jgi:hypothetical protein
MQIQPQKRKRRVENASSCCILDSKNTDKENVSMSSQCELQTINRKREKQEGGRKYGVGDALIK